jgi:hypothetical protein
VFGTSTGEVLVVLSLLAMLAASYGAQRRHRKPDRGPYRQRAPGPVPADPWRWYRTGSRLLLILPALAMIATFRAPLRIVLLVLAPPWLAALALVIWFRCPRCRRAFGGNARACRNCGLRRYQMPDPSV